MGWLSDVFKFETGHLDDIWGDINDNPERILVGAIDPASTKAWNKVLGKDWDPVVDQMGGATKRRYTDAEAKGINTVTLVLRNSANSPAIATFNSDDAATNKPNLLVT